MYAIRSYYELASQAELDSLAKVFKSLTFYKGLLYNETGNAYVLGITVNKDKMHSKLREQLILDIKERCDQFTKETGLQLHYSGLPYIRVINSIRIKKEIYLFSALRITSYNVCYTKLLRLQPRLSLRR